MIVRLHGTSVTATQPKCLSNVLTTSKRLLNEYCGLELTDEDRLTLHRFMTLEGMPLDAVEQAFEILEALKEKAKESEPPIVYSIFCQQLDEYTLRIPNTCPTFRQSSAESYWLKPMQPAVHF